MENFNIDFVEILIDNFLLANPKEIKDFLSGIKCAFHIMNSQFLHKSRSDLLWFTDKVKSLSDSLSPIYISDHLGTFFIDGLPLISMEEVQYLQDYDIIQKQLYMYQNLISRRLVIRY